MVALRGAMRERVQNGIRRAALADAARRLAALRLRRSARTWDSGAEGTGGGGASAKQRVCHDVAKLDSEREREREGSKVMSRRSGGAGRRTETSKKKDDGRQNLKG